MLAVLSHTTERPNTIVAYLYDDNDYPLADSPVTYDNLETVEEVAAELSVKGFDVYKSSCIDFP